MSDCKPMYSLGRYESFIIVKNYVDVAETLTNFNVVLPRNLKQSQISRNNGSRQFKASQLILRAAPFSMSGLLRCFSPKWHCFFDYISYSAQHVQVYLCAYIYAHLLRHKSSGSCMAHRMCLLHNRHTEHVCSTNRHTDHKSHELTESKMQFFPWHVANISLTNVSFKCMIPTYIVFEFSISIITPIYLSAVLYNRLMNAFIIVNLGTICHTPWLDLCSQGRTLTGYVDQIAWA